MGNESLLEKVRVKARTQFVEYSCSIEPEDMVLAAQPMRLEYALARIEAEARKGNVPSEIVEEWKAEAVRDYEDRHDDAKEDAEAKGWLCFSHDSEGIYIAGRAIKAMLKDCLSQLGVFQKDRGSKQSHNLGLFVEPARVRFTDLIGGEPLEQPTGFIEMAGNVSGPSGSRSILKKVDYVSHVSIDFSLLLLRGKKLTEAHLIDALALAQKVGLGGARSQGYGQFELTRFAKVARTTEDKE